MTTRRTLLCSASLLLNQVVKAQPKGGNGIIFEHDLPDLTLNDWSVTALEVSYKPGESTPAHRHPGITIAYVLEGEIRSKVGDQPEKTYTAGQMFLETPGQMHSVSRNGSNSRPAKLLAVVLTKKGAQLTTFTQG